MSDSFTQKIAKGFRITPAGHLVYDETSRYLRVWTRHLHPIGLSEEQVNKILTDNKLDTFYFTPKSGRPGWNTRRTFPFNCVRRRIPFVVISEGMALKYVPTNRSVANDKENF